MEFLLGFLPNVVADFVGRNFEWFAGGPVAALIAWVLKKIPNDVIKAKVGAFMYGLGVTATLGLSKWKWSAPFWNKNIEPWFIDAIDNIIVNGINKFKDGLRSDNA